MKTYLRYKQNDTVRTTTDVTFWTDYWGHKKVQVGKDQEKAQSEKDSHSKNRGGKKPN